MEKGNYTMKSFNGLFEAMLEPEEVKASIKEASHHKTVRRAVQWALKNIDKKSEDLIALIESDKWNPPHHRRRTLKEGSHKKNREIEKPHWDNEQIVHHMVMRQFWDITMPRTYRYTCGAVKGRGGLYAVRSMGRWVNEYNGNKFYVAELDIKGFYDNIDLDILKEKLDKFIRDKRYKNLLFKIIDASSPGLPKGYYTSPGLSNFYLMAFDNYIVQQLCPGHYLRYMDNLFLFSKNKKELHRIVDAIEVYLWNNLHLKLNKSKQVYRMEYQDRRTGQVRGRAINALGYIIHHNRITIRKSILKRARRKALKIRKLHRYRRMDAAAMLSYKGWFDHTDTYNYYKKWIKPNVSLKYCKSRISTLSKRDNERKKIQNDRLEKCA